MQRLSLLVDLASLIPREVDLDTLLGRACDRLSDAMNAERATLWLVDAERGDLVTRLAHLPEVQELRQPMGKGVAGEVAERGQVLRVDDAANDPRFDPSADEATGYRTRTLLAAPVKDGPDEPVRGVVQVLNHRGAGFDEEDERYLSALARELSHVLSMTTLRARDSERPGVVMRGPFNRIVGRSAAMEQVYERVHLSAQTDATVLLRGETGTGKTLLARAIHVNSARQNQPFVTVDCTTLPAELVESELFGHERGAFTGADRRVVGRVERAEGGTLFLDEIGDLPPRAQAKLLRFLQDRSFERVGGRETLSVDARVICATHRDLEALVERGDFREDLYYRVRVVEIEVPALRDRGPEEVERLLRHFSDLYASRYGRPSPEFSEAAVERMRTHSWPGNVRELEHWVEGAVVMAPDGQVHESKLPQPRLPPEVDPSALALPLDLELEEVRRRYVRAVLDACGGSVKVAAKRLGVGRNSIRRWLE